MTHPMTAPSEERAAVVRWLRTTPLETIGPLWARIQIAWLWLFNPQRAHQKGWLVAAKYIERGEHIGHIRKDEGHE